MKLHLFIIKTYFSKKPLFSLLYFLVLPIFSIGYILLLFSIYFSAITYSPSIDLSKTIEIDYGENLLEVINFNIKGLVFSNQNYLKVTIIDEEKNFDAKTIEEQVITIRVTKLTPLGFIVIDEQDFEVTIKINPTTISKPVISIENQENLVWMNQQDVSRYEVYFNDLYYKDVPASATGQSHLSLDLTGLFPGESKDIKIKAISAGAYRLNSDFSEKIIVNWSENPSISYQNFNITGNFLSSATQYIYYKTNEPQIKYVFNGSLQNLPAGYLSIYVYNLAQNPNTIKSLNSNTLNLEKLSTPVLSISNGQIIVSGLRPSTVFYNYDNYLGPVGTIIPEGVQFIKAKSLAVENNEISSSFSNELVVNQLPIPVLTKQGNTLQVDRQTQSIVYYANNEVFNGVIFDLSPNNYVVYAFNRGISGNNLSSARSNEIQIRKLSAPSISFANSTLTINNGNGNYKIYFNGISSFTISGNPSTWNYRDFPTGEKFFQIANLAIELSEVDSNRSNQITIHRPNVTFIKERKNDKTLTLSWNNFNTLEIGIKIFYYADTRLLKESSASNKNLFGAIVFSSHDIGLEHDETPLNPFDPLTKVTRLRFEYLLSGSAFITNAYEENYTVSWS